MKSLFRTVLVVALAITTSVAFAQNITSSSTSTTSSNNNSNANGPVSKKGEFYLPESGDWAVSFDAAPFFTYFGNMFNGTIGNGAPQASYLTNYPVAIAGKYFMDDETAVRAKLRIGMVTVTDREYVEDETSTETPPAEVEDIEKVSNTNIVLGGGIEKRKGDTRLQGVYGGEMLISYASTKTTYEYGNEVNADNDEYTNTFGQPRGLVLDKPGAQIGFGVRGFIGAEYFVLPKMSIGAEYGWGIGIASTGEGTTETEAWDGAAIETTTVNTAKDGVFTVDTDVSGFSLSLNLHF